MPAIRECFPLFLFPWQEFARACVKARRYARVSSAVSEHLWRTSASFRPSSSRPPSSPDEPRISHSRRPRGQGEAPTPLLQGVLGSCNPPVFKPGRNSQTCYRA